MYQVSQHAFEAARTRECGNSVFAKRTEIQRYADLKKDDLSETLGFLQGAYLALRLGKCFTYECLPIFFFLFFFGGMAQKLCKITALNGDICKQAISILNVRLPCFSSPAEFLK